MPTQRTPDAQRTSTTSTTSEPQPRRKANLKDAGAPAPPLPLVAVPRYHTRFTFPKAGEIAAIRPGFVGWRVAGKTYGYDLFKTCFRIRNPDFEITHTEKLAVLTHGLPIVRYVYSVIDHTQPLPSDFTTALAGLSTLLASVHAAVDNDPTLRRHSNEWDFVPTPYMPVQHYPAHGLQARPPHSNFTASVEQLANAPSLFEEVLHGSERHLAFQRALGLAPASYASSTSSTTSLTTRYSQPPPLTDPTDEEPEEGEYEAPSKKRKASPASSKPIKGKEKEVTDENNNEGEVAAPPAKKHRGTLIKKEPKSKMACAPVESPPGPNTRGRKLVKFDPKTEICVKVDRAPTASPIFPPLSYHHYARCSLKSKPRPPARVPRYTPLFTLPPRGTIAVINPDFIAWKLAGNAEGYELFMTFFRFRHDKFHMDHQQKVDLLNAGLPLFRYILSKIDFSVALPPDFTTALAGLGDLLDSIREDIYEDRSLKRIDSEWDYVLVPSMPRSKYPAHPLNARPPPSSAVIPKTDLANAPLLYEKVPQSSERAIAFGQGSGRLPSPIPSDPPAPEATTKSREKKAVYETVEDLSGDDNQPPTKKHKTSSGKAVVPSHMPPPKIPSPSAPIIRSRNPGPVRLAENPAESLKSSTKIKEKDVASDYPGIYLKNDANPIILERQNDPVFMACLEVLPRMLEEIYTTKGNNWTNAHDPASGSFHDALSAQPPSRACFNCTILSVDCVANGVGLPCSNCLSKKIQTCCDHVVELRRTVQLYRKVADQSGLLIPLVNNNWTRFENLVSITDRSHSVYRDFLCAITCESSVRMAFVLPSLPPDHDNPIDCMNELIDVLNERFHSSPSSSPDAEGETIAPSTQRDIPEDDSDGADASYDRSPKRPTRSRKSEDDGGEPMQVYSPKTKVGPPKSKGKKTTTEGGKSPIPLLQPDTVAHSAVSADFNTKYSVVAVENKVRQWAHTVDHHPETKHYPLPTAVETFTSLYAGYRNARAAIAKVAKVQAAESFKKAQTESTAVQEKSSKSTKSGDPILPKIVVVVTLKERPETSKRARSSTIASSATNALLQCQCPAKKTIHDSGSNMSILAGAPPLERMILHYASQKSRKEDDDEIMFIDDIYKIVEHATQVRDKSEHVAATAESLIRTDNYIRIRTALTSVARLASTGWVGLRDNAIANAAARAAESAAQTGDPIVPEFEIPPSGSFNRGEALAEPGMLLITAEMQGPTKAIIDADDGVIVILNCGPTEATNWECVTNQASTAMDNAAKLLYGPEYNQEPLGNSSRRGPHYAEHMGAGMGGGQRRPTPFTLHSAVRQILMLLLLNSAIARFISMANFLFQLYAPRLYAYYLETMQALQTWDPNLPLLAPLLSCVFACITFNFGPQTVTLLHLDFLNLAWGWCFITAPGWYDHRKGGHLIIWDLRLVIEFSPGATFAIPSAVLRHSNVSIQKGEKRFSITQYTSVGLFRFVNNSFQMDITGKASMSKAEEREFAAAAQRRYSEGIEMHSTLEDLKMRAFMYSRIPNNPYLSVDA
ncbi:hypothetical protein MSAN_02360700 [Mycena sanguinolenta]|uniref:Uncharacterized protein n=1 Tax=Mycena sanguinolenta TaxID=230812 RepID=A0A8H6X604_9AGAR|nr:hypothetical protein MSAN_02360700 [Mycena sanguinolenta]